MRGFYGILLGSFLITAACDDDDPTEPQLHASASTDRNSYLLADTIRLTLSNTSADEELIVPVCEYGEFPLIRVDRMSNGRWETVQSTGCLGPSVVGLSLGPGEELVQEYAANDWASEAGTYRIGVEAHPPGIEDASEIEWTFTGSFTIE